MTVIDTGTRKLIVRQWADCVELTLRDFDLLQLSESNSIVHRHSALVIQGAQFKLNKNDAMILSDMLAEAARGLPLEEKYEAEIRKQQGIDT